MAALSSALNGFVAVAPAADPLAACPCACAAWEARARITIETAVRMRIDRLGKRGLNAPTLACACALHGRYSAANCTLNRGRAYDDAERDLVGHDGIFAQKLNGPLYYPALATYSLIRATRRPCAVSTATRRNVATISAAVCHFVLILSSSIRLKAIPQGRPLL